MIDLTFHQRGQVPENASSLSFVSGGLMEMRINAELVYTSDPNRTGFPSVDVSRFAGQVVDLDFHVLQFPGSGASYFFDVIGFTQVPEPSTWALFGVGGAVMGWGLRRRR
jgi:PEP-CTERM motif